MAAQVCIRARVLTARGAGSEPGPGTSRSPSRGSCALLPGKTTISLATCFLDSRPVVGLTLTSLGPGCHARVTVALESWPSAPVHMGPEIHKGAAPPLSSSDKVGLQFKDWRTPSPCPSEVFSLREVTGVLRRTAFSTQALWL